jgi:hypothetical protein
MARATEKTDFIEISIRKGIDLHLLRRDVVRRSRAQFVEFCQEDQFGPLSTVFLASLASAIQARDKSRQSVLIFHGILSVDQMAGSRTHVLLFGA